MVDAVYTAICSAATLSNKDGFFQQILDNVCDSVNNEWLEQFGKLKSNQDRIRACLNHEWLSEIIDQMLSNVQPVYREKDATLARTKRLEGEKWLKQNELKKALALYTQSVIKAPSTDTDKFVDNGRSLALAFLGRSQTLFASCEYQLCLEDIKTCLREKLPDHMKPGAYWTMCECYIALGKLNHAKVTLNILTTLVTTINASEKVRQFWNGKIKSKLEKVESSISSDNNVSASKEDEDKMEHTILNTHPDIPNVCDKLSIARNDYAGRYFVASKKINTGETLVFEDPYVACLSTERFGTHCLHCMKWLEIAIPCEECSAVAFCSPECRSIASSTYHKYECHFLDLLIGSGMSLLSFAAFRIMTQQKVDYFFNFDTSPDNDNNHNNADYFTQVYNMVTHEEQRSSVDFLNRTFMAFLLLAVLKKSNYFVHSEEIISEEEIFIASLILKNLEVLQFNAHEISECIKTNEKDRCNEKIKNIGIGLYKSASFFNHSCYPAVTRYFIGTRLVVKTSRPVEEGDTVFDNYGPHYTKMKKDERRRYLSGRYWFECTCNACTENWQLCYNPYTNYKNTNLELVKS